MKANLPEKILYTIILMLAGVLAFSAVYVVAMAARAIIMYLCGAWLGCL